MASRSITALHNDLPLCASRPLRLLLVEGVPADAELVVAALKRDGYLLSFDVVDRPEAFRERLQQAGYDIILSDHHLPTWSGMDALEMLKNSGKSIPFIVLTGTLGDEAAVEYIKRGAADYVLKHRLEHLSPAVGQALRDKSHREKERRLQEQILHAKRQWEMTFDAVPDPVIVVDQHCRVLRANQAASDMLAMPVAEIIGRPCQELILGVAQIPPNCPDAGMVATHVAQRSDIRESRSGKTFDTTTTPLRDVAGASLGCIHVMRDVTERSRAAEALRESEEKYRQLVENASYGIYRSSSQGDLLDVNPALVAMLGYGSKQELLQVNLARDVYADPAERAAIFADLESRSRVDVVARWKRKDGTPLIVRITARAIRGEDGRVTHCEAIAEDITERRSLEDQLRQAQKMEAVGQVAGGVAHDFNNILMIVGGYAELLQQNRLPEESARRVAQIQEAARKGSAIVRQLLAFSRKQVLEPRVLDLNKLLAELAKLLPRLLGESIELDMAPAAGLGNVKADPGQIEQVIMNLALNARDAMPKGGRLTIETADVELDHYYARQHASVTPGSYVMLAASDNGCGMTPETLKHIFEPFFTTKEQGKGTGLGLATAYGIVKQSGGFIGVYSEPGRGTTFKIYLPRVAETAASEAPAPAKAISRSGRETILLVEDEPALREVCREFLSAKGYRILPAANGAEALRLCLAQEAPIELLLTDLAMPGVGGTELAASFSRLYPQGRVIFMSGYSERNLDADALGAGAILLQKPFPLELLAQKVREVLDMVLVASV